MIGLIRTLYKIPIFKRLIPSIIKIYVKLFNINEKIIINKQIKLSLNLNNPIDREIYLKGQYEEKQIHYLQQLISKNKIDVFIDIGAHMGFYSMNMSINAIQIHSFEPVMNNFIQLKRNKDLNKFDNIKLYNFALSDEEKKIKMWVPDKYKTGGFSVYDDNDKEMKKYNMKKIFKLESECKKGDDILKIRNKKIAIKIDVERHEKKVLKGITNLIKKNKTIIQIELFDERVSDVTSLLKKESFIQLNQIKRDFYFKNY